MPNVCRLRLRNSLGLFWPEWESDDMLQSAAVQPGDATHVEQIVAYDTARSGEADLVSELLEAAKAGWLQVATCDQRVLGHAIVRPRAFFGFDFLDLVYVAETARRGGVGHLLVAAIRDRAADRVWTSTNLSNAPMHRLLRTDGWQPAGMLDGLDEGDPEVFYFSDSNAAEESH